MTGIVAGPPIHAWEDEIELKRQYAALLVQHGDASYITSSFEVFPGSENFGRAIQAQAWIGDSIVIAEMRRLRSTKGVEERKVSNEVIEAEILEIARDPTHPVKDRIKAYDSIAAMRGLGTKGGTNVKVDARTVNVLRVPSKVTNEDREDFALRFKRQQTALIADVRTIKSA